MTLIPRRSKVVDYKAVCPWGKCKGRTEIGLWAAAHLCTDKMVGKCSKCGKPVYIDERYTKRK